MTEVPETEWIYELSADQLREEAEKRALGVDGSTAVLRARIARFERWKRRDSGKGEQLPTMLSPPETRALPGEWAEGTKNEEFVWRDAMSNDGTRSPGRVRTVLEEPEQAEELPLVEGTAGRDSRDRIAAETERQNYGKPIGRPSELAPPPVQVPNTPPPVESRPQRTLPTSVPTALPYAFPEDGPPRVPSTSAYSRPSGIPATGPSGGSYAFPTNDPSGIPTMGEHAFPLNVPPMYPSAESRRQHTIPPEIPRQTRRENYAVSANEAWNAMRKWNLNFSGARGMDAEDFLRRIENGRAIVPMLDEDVFKCLPFFLSGIAAHWYRAKQTQWLSWGQFREAFRTRFSDPDYQFALRDEICRRTQGEHEPVADYISCMLALFDRLSPPWTLYEQLEYAHRNMLPRLQVAVLRDNVTDFETLELLARRVERSYNIAKTYRAPPLPEQSLCPELAYQPPPRSARAPNMNATEMMGPGIGYDRMPYRSEPPRARAPPPVTPVAPARPAAPARVPGVSREGQRATPTSGAPTQPERPPRNAQIPARRPGTTEGCWNCGGAGHRARTCPAPPKIHCYRCGRAEVTVKNCPECSGNGQRSS